MASKNLELKLKKIGDIFDIKNIADIKIDLNYIQKYYKINSLPYTIFHTYDDFMYMGISKDGVYKKEDLKAHAKFVDQYIKKSQAKNVLEIASGRSANTAFLATNNPNVNFYGIELSEGQFKHAQKKANKLPNLTVQQGDYHNLESCKNNEFDIVYAVEALCYSCTKETVFKEVNRVLNQNGYFIIFDGYKSSKKLDPTENLSCNLTEKSMAIETFEKYNEVLQKAITTGFTVDYEENLSQYVLPTMRRFERLSKIYFETPLAPLLPKLLAKTLPKEFTLNSVAGYLMPTLIEDNIAKYMVTVLRSQCT